MTEPEDAAVLSAFLDWLEAVFEAVWARYLRKHLPLLCTYLDLTFVSARGEDMALATVVFDPPVPPKNTKDAVTARSLTVTVDGSAMAPVEIDLTATSHAVPGSFSTGQIMVATLTDTNSTGSRVVGTVSRAVPDLTPGQLPLDATGLDVTFVPDPA